MKSISITKEAGVQRQAKIGLDNEERRHAWVRSALERLPAGGRILDAGAGSQRYREYCGHLRYVSQDFGQYDGRGDHTGLQTGEFNYGKLDIVSDITAIPEPDGSFDAVLCTEVIEHVPSPEAALQELGRLLRQGGELILTAPFVSFTHFAPYHYCTGFNRYYYRQHLEAFGFEIIDITPNGGFFDLVAQELRRVNSIAETYAHDRLNTIERLAHRIVLNALKRFRETDRSSWEFACFGLHVRARKRSATS